MDQNPPTDNSDNGKLKELEKEVDDLGQKAKEEVSSTPQNPVSGQGGQPSTSDAEQTTQNTPPQNPQDPKKNKNVVVWIAASLLALSLVGVGAYYFSSGRKSVTSPSPAPTLSTPVVTTEPDVTEGWETYTDGNIGYSIKYPPEWSYELGETVKTTGHVVFDTGVQSKTQRGSEYINYTLGVSLDTLENYLQWSQNTIQTQSLGTETTNEMLFEKYIVGDMGYSLNFIYKTDNDKIFRFLMSPYENDKTPPIPKDLEQIIIQVLSTFEFTKVSPSSSPTANPSETP